MVKLKRIMIGGLAVVASALTMQAQTLTQDWKVSQYAMTPLPTNARDGIGGKGKIWTNDNTTNAQALVYWDETGQHKLSVGAGGTAITMDEAGNIIVSTSMFGAGNTAYKILPVGESTLKDLTVKLPDGVSAAGMQYLGRAKGNVMSEEGGVFYIGSTVKPVRVFVAEGKQVEAKTIAIETGMEAGAETIVQPITSSLEEDAIVLRNRKNADFYYWNGTKYAAYPAATPTKANNTCGGDAFELNGVLYTIEPCGTNYVDGFNIVDRSMNKVVASHEAVFSTPKRQPNGNSLTAEKVDEYTVRIYQYVPGQIAAQYTFSLPKPTPKPTYYILGQNEEGEAWDPTRGIEMTTEDGVWYTATVTTVAGRENFAIVTALAENNDDGGWEYVNSRRYGLATDNQDGAVAEDIMMRRNTNAVRLGIGTFFIRFGGDFNYLYAVPTRLYAFGNSNKADGHDWDSADVSYMAESDPATPGVFTFSPIDLKVVGKAVGEEDANDLSYFAFKTNADGDWEATNGNRWCPDHKNGEMTDNTEYRDFGKNTDGAFCIKNGAYELTVDLNLKTIKAVYLTATSVEEVEEAAARVIAADGAIRIEGEASSVSVYNAAGQAVAVNTQERMLSVARGMYVVVVDGRATKVVVR